MEAVRKRNTDLGTGVLQLRIVSSEILLALFFKRLFDSLPMSVIGPRKHQGGKQQ